MPIKVTPLSQALGAEISGVDLTRPFDAETAKAINKAWLEHLVIVIRGQQLSDEDQVQLFRSHRGLPAARCLAITGNEGTSPVSDVRQ